MSAFFFVKLLKISIGLILLGLWWLGGRLHAEGKRLAGTFVRSIAVAVAVAPIAWALTVLYVATGLAFFPLVLTLVLVPVLLLGIPCYIIGKRRGYGLLS